MKKITVIKQNYEGLELWRYTGQELFRRGDLIALEALFNRSDTPVKEIIIKNKDIFREVFFNNRWYNIFEIYDRDDHQLKGWYCDICKPAIFSDCEISYCDLSLDLLVIPDGRKFILDEDEFHKLPLDEETKKKALTSLSELKENFFEIIRSIPKVQA